MLTVNELFSGIGAPRKALINAGIDHKIIGISEIDRFAITSYEAVYGPTRNYGDISKIDKLDYADLWTYGFPCQDISLSGKQAGITEETRSGLLWSSAESRKGYRVQCKERHRHGRLRFP